MKQRWTHDLVRLEAKKYNKMDAWARVSPGSYAYAKKHNILLECSSHIQSRFLWDYESVKAKAKLYRTKKEWIADSIGSYQRKTRTDLEVSKKSQKDVGLFKTRWWSLLSLSQNIWDY